MICLYIAIVFVIVNTLVTWVIVIQLLFVHCNSLRNCKYSRYSVKIERDTGILGAPR